MFFSQNFYQLCFYWSHFTNLLLKIEMYLLALWSRFMIYQESWFIFYILPTTIHPLAVDYSRNDIIIWNFQYWINFPIFKMSDPILVFTLICTHALALHSISHHTFYLILTFASSFCNSLASSSPFSITLPLLLLSKFPPILFKLKMNIGSDILNIGKLIQYWKNSSIDIAIKNHLQG